MTICTDCGRNHAAKDRCWAAPPASELEAALKQAKAALKGDSNDAEHDALYQLAEYFEKLQAVPTPAKSVSFDVHLVGFTWAYAAPLPHSYKAVAWDNEKWTPEQIRKIAGDFRSVTDYEVIKHVSWHEKIEGGWRSVHEATVVRPWTDKKAEALWERQNG